MSLLLELLPALILLFMGKHLGLTGKDAFDFIKIIHTGFEKLDKAQIDPLRSLVVVLVLTYIPLTLLRYWLYGVMAPGFSDLIESARNRGPELTVFTRRLLADHISHMKSFLAAAEGSHPWGSPMKQVKHFQRIVADSSHAKTVYMTTLESIPNLAVSNGFREMTENTLASLKRGQKLVRFIVCDDFDALFDPACPNFSTTGWFVRQHRLPNVELCYVSSVVLRNIATEHGIDVCRLDFQMFGTRVLFGLLNDSDTLSLVKWKDDGTEMYNLYAVDDEDLIKAYSGMIGRLQDRCKASTITNCGEVMATVTSRGWAGNY